jgi:hypothetical protein
MEGLDFGVILDQYSVIDVIVLCVVIGIVLDNGSYVYRPNTG